jgi:hypothetical protein
MPNASHGFTTVHVGNIRDRPFLFDSPYPSHAFLAKQPHIFQHGGLCRHCPLSSVLVISSKHRLAFFVRRQPQRFPRLLFHMPALSPPDRAPEMVIFELHRLRALNFKEANSILLAQLPSSLRAFHAIFNVEKYFAIAVSAIL